MGGQSGSGPWRALLLNTKMEGVETGAGLRGLEERGHGTRTGAQMTGRV